MSTTLIVAIAWAVLMLLTYGYIYFDYKYTPGSIVRQWKELRDALTEE